jgi:hypothetical protein
MRRISPHRNGATLRGEPTCGIDYSVTDEVRIRSRRTDRFAWGLPNSEADLAIPRCVAGLRLKVGLALEIVYLTTL